MSSLDPNNVYPQQPQASGAVAFSRNSPIAINTPGSSGSSGASVVTMEALLNPEDSSAPNSNIIQGRSSTIRTSKVIMLSNVKSPKHNAIQIGNSQHHQVLSQQIQIQTSATSARFQCLFDGCTRTFSLKKNMYAHWRTHAGITYPCPFAECGKTFSLASVLRVHQRVHTGERPYQCEYIDCSKAFRDSGSLAKHRRTHTGERPFNCAVCGKTFTQSGHLSRHSLKHQ
jgi:uncharacterized Zn-finger protein